MVLLVYFLDMIWFQVYGGELVLFQGVVMKFKKKSCCNVADNGIVSMAPLQGFYIEYMMF